MSSQFITCEHFPGGLGSKWERCRGFHNTSGLKVSKIFGDVPVQEGKYPDKKQ